MVTLNGKHIFLRAIEPDDIDFILKVENDETTWHISNTQLPCSRNLIERYIQNAQQDIFEAKQLRLVISDHNNQRLGFVDVFDFDFFNKHAGVGILIYNSEERRKGYGKEALQLLVNYCFTHLQLHQLYCNISEDNTASLNLFKGEDFQVIGLKKDWQFRNGTFQNEYMLQRIKRNTK